MTRLMTESNIEGVKLISRGKVRDIYDLGDRLLLVATDRLSAFDVVLPDPIPEKGSVLTGLSAFWFGKLKAAQPNHMLTVNADEFPEELKHYKDELEGRSLLTKKANVVPVECVVRGYLSGSGWVSYQKEGHVCGIKLPDGLQNSSRLPEPIFTPTTKAKEGHDEPMTFEQMVELLGREEAEELRERSLALYNEAAEYARERGIIIADTKFEWGRSEGKIILIDEVLTPDSSRFWPADRYEEGKTQPSFDKQIVRNYLLELGWDKKPPAPNLPAEIIEKTSACYREVARRLIES
ncbi:MAG: phosphoribosylaminoimidazolesuccinocarboxamide synthase [Planctomycetota bacterium]